MGKKRRRRSFSPEFKAEAVKVVQQSGKSPGAVARELDLTETALRRWVAQAETDAGRGRRVVGWALRNRITRELAVEALTMALAHRQPDPGLVHHSDRGSQYASGDYRAVLDAHGVVLSMSRRGNCWDNAVAESFFSTLKIELAHEADWATHADAYSAVFEYLEIFYNGQRRHSVLGYLSPIAFERQHEQKRAA